MKRYYYEEYDALEKDEIKNQYFEDYMEREERNGYGIYDLFNKYDDSRNTMTDRWGCYCA